MRLVRSYSNIDAMLMMYRVVSQAREVEIRAAKCRNVHNLAIVLNSEQPVFTSFEDRKFNLTYAKREWLWYLGADRFDSSIEKYATMWKKLRQPDGSYYSNYGQYIFGPSADPALSQFDYVVHCLTADRYSRRASMMLLQPKHLFLDNVDTVCTYAINFTIEDHALHMTVMMRSNDVIFGFTNDSFCFWQLHMFMHRVMQGYYPSLHLGSYTHIANSMHVYERHYPMIETIVRRGADKYISVEAPTPTLPEVMDLIESRGERGTGPYVEWLKAES